MLAGGFQDGAGDIMSDPDNGMRRHVVALGDGAGALEKSLFRFDHRFIIAGRRKLLGHAN